VKPGRTAFSSSARGTCISNGTLSPCPLLFTSTSAIGFAFLSATPCSSSRIFRMPAGSEPFSA
jgi:hypothetical protein